MSSYRGPVLNGPFKGKQLVHDGRIKNLNVRLTGAPGGVITVRQVAYLWDGDLETGQGFWKMSRADEAASRAAARR